MLKCTAMSIKRGIRTVEIVLAIITTQFIKAMMRTMINTDGFPHSSDFNKYGIVFKSVQGTEEQKYLSVCANCSFTVTLNFHVSFWLIQKFKAQPLSLIM